MACVPHSNKAMMTPTAYGRSKVRLAVVLGSWAPLIEYIHLIGSPRLSDFWIVHVILGGLAFVVGVACLWALGLPAILLASWLVHSLVGGDVSWRIWRARTALALWPLPYAAVLGAGVWLVYSLGHYGGWPGDMVFGTIGNLIGAWCYGSILLAWGRLLWKPRVSTGMDEA